jgi:hypothetical protein
LENISIFHPNRFPESLAHAGVKGKEADDETAEREPVGEYQGKTHHDSLQLYVVYVPALLVQPV